MDTRDIENMYFQNVRLSKLEEALAYEFKDRTLLYTALTHRSFTHEQRDYLFDNNQRFEFVGDAVLSLTIASETFKRFPDMAEGQMTKIRAAVVCEEALADCAKTINLADYLLLGNGEIQDGGREKASILADTMEALFSAVYLDSDYYEAASCVLGLMSAYIDLAVAGKLSEDYKTKLLEYAQAQKERVLPKFEIIASSGPVHKKLYIARVSMGSLEAEGSGATKKQAEQEAARQLLDML